MELRGVIFPGSLVRDWMREADVAHVSNEVSFDQECPAPNPNYKNFILCSDPKYMELLLDIGTDAVELTGDHFADRGQQAMLDTLKMYKDNGLPYYGGGANAEEARRPLLMEVNGNKIAFMGCNGKRPEKYPKADAKTPGAAGCDYDYFTEKIRDLKSRYLVIFTFQHEECYSMVHVSIMRFHAVADAGVDVVSGSQAHYPTWRNSVGFIHPLRPGHHSSTDDYSLPGGEVIDATRREFRSACVLR
jgi:poly-gamma-glutamate synthesis protein (capsule biosynthesis protein)